MKGKYLSQEPLIILTDKPTPIVLAVSEIAYLTSINNSKISLTLEGDCLILATVNLGEFVGTGEGSITVSLIQNGTAVASDVFKDEFLSPVLHTLHISTLLSLTTQDTIELQILQTLGTDLTITYAELIVALLP